MTKIQQFLSRIGMAPETPVEQTVEFLGRVQTNCVLNLAYENLDILEGKPILLDDAALFDKIVTRGRGGYCFELNGLLTAMLREMGFSVTERFARYLRGESEIPMRRHRVAIVSLPGGDYLCDIGVGQVAPRLPRQLEDGLDVVPQDEGHTRLVEAAQDLLPGAAVEGVCYVERDRCVPSVCISVCHADTTHVHSVECICSVSRRASVWVLRRLSLSCETPS